MSSFHPAGWPAPVLLRPEERHQTPQQMKPTAPPRPRGPLPENGPTDRKAVSEFRWLSEGKQSQLGSSGGVVQLSSVTPGQSRLGGCGLGLSSTEPDMADTCTKEFLVGKP